MRNSAAPEPLAAGQNLASRYQLLKRLARGGSGEVWLAEDSERDEQVALKILRTDLANDAARLDVLRREYLLLHELTHPGIVPVYDFHEVDGLAFISMRYASGSSLARYRGEDWRQVVELVLPVTEALEYAHRQGLVHRDIKASNILLGAQQQPLLSDFGIAAIIDADNRVSPGGSLPAMSPQQVNGDAPAISDDVYGFGAMLYELIAGQPLFHPEVTRERVLEAIPPRLDSLGLWPAPPADLVGLVATMLQKNPLHRPQTIAAVRAALERLLNIEHSSFAAQHLITPKRRSTTKPDTPDHLPPLQPSTEPRTAGLSRGLVAAVAILVMALLVVVLWLPDYIAKRDPIVDVEPVRRSANETGVVASEPAVSAEQLQEQRRAADTALSDVLRLTDKLTALAVTRWGGEAWQRILRDMQTADAFYKSRDYLAAQTAYNELSTAMSQLLAQSADVLQAAIADGVAAFEAGNQQRAIDRLELALAIDPGNAMASNTLARAQVLDQVLLAMNTGVAAEAAGNWTEAAAAYRRALEFDPEWLAAQEGQARVSREVAGQRYSGQMSAGFAALNNKDYAGAKAAFNDALIERRGDSAAVAALVAVQQAAQLATVKRLLAKAKVAEATERWAVARDEYGAVLKLDPTMVTATEGRARSMQREQLHQQLLQALAAADTYNDQRVWDRADALLQRAAAIEGAGPVLQAQIAELQALLNIAAIPLPVSLVSDGETNVVIYKVGRLGRFTEKTLELRPGVYTAVGNRAGYRDVRQTFRVTATAAMRPIVVECREAI